MSNRPHPRRVPRPRTNLYLVRLEDRLTPSNSIPLNSATWTAIGPAPINNGQTNGHLACAGRIDGVAADPTNANVVYVSTAGGGVWKTTNATAANPSWTPLTDNQATLVATGIAVAPSNPSIIYVATGDADGAAAYSGRGILKSIDGGTTWTLLTDNGVFTGQTVNRIVVDPTNPNTIYATVGAYFNDGYYGSLPVAAGVYKSTDGGATWANTTGNVAPHQPWLSLVMDPTTPTTLYAATSNLYSNYPGGPANGVYKTINGGASWSLVAGGLPSGAGIGRISLALAASNPGTVYMCYASETDQTLAAVYKSIDAGTGWTNITPGSPQNQVFGTSSSGQGNYDNVIAVDPTDPNVAYIGGSFLTAVIATFDGGATWATVGDNQGLTAAGPHADMHAMAFDVNDRLLTGCDGGLFGFTRTGTTGTWATLNGSAASGALGIIQSNEVALHPTNPNIAFDAAQDAGTTEFTDGLGWANRSNGGDGGAVSVDPNNPNNVYFVYTFNQVYRSTNGGVSFSQANTGLPSGANFVPPLVIDPHNSNRLLFGASAVYSSLNASFWSQLGTNPGVGTIDAIAVGAAGSTIYVSGTNNGVFNVRVSTDNGATWGGVTPTGGTRRFVHFAVDPVNMANAYVVNNSLAGTRIWRTSNSGQSWTSIMGTGLPDEQFQTVAYDPGPTTASTDDRLLVGTVSGVYVSTDIASASPTWTRLGIGLPNVVVRDLKISPTTGILAAATYGRGIWEVLTGPIYADTRWAGLATGTVIPDADPVASDNQPAVIGTNAFASVNAAIAAAGAGGKVIVNGDDGSGNYGNFAEAVALNSATTLSLQSGPVTFGSLAGTATGAVVSLNGVSLSAGGNGGSTEYDGTIIGTGGLTKAGAGTLTLGGNETYTGATTANAGILLVNGSLASVSAVGVAAGATLGGNGTIGATTVSGILAPGTGVGVLTSGATTINGGGALSVQLNGTAAGAGYSELVAGGPINISGSTLVVTVANGFTPPAGTPFDIVVNNSGSAITGAFAGLAEGATFMASGQTYQITYHGGTSGNDAVLTRVNPPPVTVQSIQVNDGSIQRSEVRSITVTFSAAVSFAGGDANAAAAFQLSHVQTGNTVTLAAAVSTNGSGQTAVTLTFSGGETDPVSGLNGGVPSLADGRYQLSILAANISGPNGATFAGGQPNGNYVSPAESFGGAGLHLYRLFADANGDGVVDAIDLGQFRSTFNANNSQANYLVYLDSDNSGAVDAQDLGQFRSRFNVNIF